MSIMGVEVDSLESDGLEDSGFKPKMVVVGVGGGGGNAVSHMVKAHLDGVKTICVNTDVQALRKSMADTKVQIGAKMTGGLGCGADPSRGRAAAEEDLDKIKDAITGNHIVFIAVGEGGGTGTGGAPVVAAAAKELGILSIAVVTKPFSYEGTKRARNAEEGIKALASFADTLIVIPNDKLLKVLGNKVTVLNAFSQANDVLLNAVRGISSSLLEDGHINLDFNDLRRCMENGGNAIIGIGMASGPERAQEAVQKAIVCPLLDDIDLKGAKSLFVNVRACGDDFGMDELDFINTTVHDYAAPDAEIISGATFYTSDEDVDPEARSTEICVTIIATGVGGKVDEKKEDAPAISIGLDSSAPLIDIGADEIFTVDDSPFFMQADGGDDLEKPTFLRKQAD